MLMAYKDIIDAEQFTKDDIAGLLDLSLFMHQKLTDRADYPVLKNYIMASLFFEASTRTRLSFEAAMQRLGGQVISTTGVQFSSMAKGETLYDTMKMMEAYCDIAVVRHPVEGSSRIAARAVQIPVVNAGDGAGQHPTQALLDLYTIYQEKKTIDGLEIAFIGDLKYGRTIHSLIHLLKWYRVSMTFISPAELALPDNYKRQLTDHGISYRETTDIHALWDADIAYVTRIQEERFPDHRDYERLKLSYVVNKELLLGARKPVSIMHPLPRVGELSTDVDEMPNALYFRQASNGVACRMAILAQLTGKQ